jgi:hypothetical protein
VPDKYGVNTDEFDEALYNEFNNIGNDRNETKTKTQTKDSVTEKDVNFIFEIIKKEAPYDQTAIKQLFYGMSSGLTKTPLPHNVNSRQSGAGKSYDLMLVAGCFPSKHIIPLSNMSDRAMFHQNGTLVMENEATNETENAEPILERLEVEIEDLEDEIDDVKRSKNDANKTTRRKELRKRLRELKKELNDTKQKVQKLIILDGKILLVLDTARDSFYNALMSLVSQDTKEDQKYVFAEQTNGRKFVARTNRLRGTPVIFTTQVLDDTKQQRFGEKNRRFVNVNPDTSERKISAAKRLIGLRGGLLPEEYDLQVVSRDDKYEVKEICARITEKLIDHSKHLEKGQTGIKIPFIESIPYSIPGDPNDVWGMTVMDRLIKYLAVITKVKMDFRPKLVDTVIPGRFFPVATFDDLLEALQILSKASSALRPYIANWYNRVFITGFNERKNSENPLNKTVTVSGKTVESENVIGLSTKYLAERTQQILGGIKPSREDVREQYLEPLYNLGIVDKFKSEENKTENLYCPVDDISTSNIFSMIDDSNPDDFRLKVTDSSLFPCNEILLDSFRTIIKQGAEMSTSTSDIFSEENQRYKLVDVDGYDLTPQELIDKYLNNPYKAFKCAKLDGQNQALVRPMLNNMWMYSCLRPILQQFSNNDTEEKSDSDPGLEP